MLVTATYLIIEGERAVGCRVRYTWEYGQGIPVDINESGAYLRSDRTIFYINAGIEKRGSLTVDVFSEFVFVNPTNSTIEPRIILPSFETRAHLENISIWSPDIEINWSEMNASELVDLQVTALRYYTDGSSRDLGSFTISRAAYEFGLTIGPMSELQVFIEYSRLLPYQESGRPETSSSLFTEKEGWRTAFFFRFEHVTSTGRYWDHPIEHAIYQVWIEDFLLPDTDDLSPVDYNWTEVGGNDTHRSFIFEFINWTPDSSIGIWGVNWEISYVEWQLENPTLLVIFLYIMVPVYTVIITITCVLYWRQQRRLRKGLQKRSEGLSGKTNR